MEQLKRVKMQAMWLLHLHKHDVPMRASGIDRLLKYVYELLNFYIKDGYIFEYEIKRRSREEVHRLGIEMMEG